jgi:RimJ/RimL family protein N-acetyltransferase
MNLVTDQPGERPLVWEWMHRRNSVPWSSDLRTIGLMRSDGSIAAAIGFNAWQTQSCFMHVAFDSPHCLTRSLLRAAFEYPLVKSGKDAVYALVDKHNEACLNLVRKLGYRETSQTVDAVLFEMLRDECRWIKEQEHGQVVSTVHA